MEYEKIFKHLGNSPYWITFSGGEPFLKKNLVDIVNICYDLCNPGVINIPSNGILTEKIVHNVQSIAEHCQKASIIINLSIDGIENEHDFIRGVEGNYIKVINTFYKLKNLNLKNLYVGIHTVISTFNINNFVKIANTLINLNPDQYITEIAEERIELLNIGINITPSLNKYKPATDFLIHRIKNTNISKLMNKITQSFRIEYYNFVQKILHKKTQIIPCYAGIASIQISPDGEVWSCCIKAKSLGNLRQTNYHLKNIWKNYHSKMERKFIKSKGCYCPLANAAYTNMLMDFSTIRKVIYRAIITWKNTSPKLKQKSFLKLFSKYKYNSPLQERINHQSKGLF